MVAGKALWFSVLLIGSSWGLPTPEPQIMFPCPPPCPPPCPEPTPDPCPPPPCEEPCPQESTQLKPCDPNDPAVRYAYGQAPTGAYL